jgi:hypothetical protein
MQFASHDQLWYNTHCNVPPNLNRLNFQIFRFRNRDAIMGIFFLTGSLKPHVSNGVMITSLTYEISSIIPLNLYNGDHGVKNGF